MVKIDEQWLDAALAVAREAATAGAEAIARHAPERVDVEYKADASPVTVADREAETAIRRVLLAHYPDHAIFGEEQGRQGEGEFLWLVDPLDGTKSFVRGTPFYSTQVALMHEGELLLGVSAAPHYGETLWARRGGGARMNGEPIRVAATDSEHEAVLSIGNVRTLAGHALKWRELGELVRGVNRVRGYGDFCHYHLLARGALDIVVESDVNILDIAALAVIVREAGGVFTDLTGAGLTLDTTSVLAAVPALHEGVRQRLSDRSVEVPHLHRAHLAPGATITHADTAEILARRRGERSRFLHTEELDLQFSNGVHRTYERILNAGSGAVIIVPMRDADNVLLIREYAAGLGHYELGLPKGRLEAGESATAGADRELKEEAGYGAQCLDALGRLSLAPAYMSHLTDVVLARDLYPERLPGDEPEEMEVVPWKLSELHALMARDDVTEGRTLAALFMAREYLAGRYRVPA